MVKVVLFGTHPSNANGYSKVVHSISKVIGSLYSSSIELVIFGVQHNESTVASDALNRNSLVNVTIIDGAKFEGGGIRNDFDEKKQGYGIGSLPTFIDVFKPDYLIIYNSPDVIIPVQNIVKQHCTHSVKMIPYIDMVYEGEDPSHYPILAQNSWGLAFFTTFWRDMFIEKCPSAKDMPTFIIRHGVDQEKNCVLTKHSSLAHPASFRDLARSYFDLPSDAFVFGNFNRNNLRKRLDLNVQAFAKFILDWVDNGSEGRVPYMLFGQRIRGAWDLKAVYVHAIEDAYKHKHGSSIDQDLLATFAKHFKSLKRSQFYSDFEINMLYHCTDVGINTCVGEGWGLCNYEHAWLGYPQIVPELGGFKEWCLSDHVTMVPPSISIYDPADESSTHSGIKVQFKMINPCEFASEMYRMYTKFSNSQLPITIDMTLSENMTGFYTWESIVQDLVNGLCVDTSVLN